MTHIIAERMTAKIEDEVIVFLIGMRINRIWKVHKWRATQCIPASGRRESASGRMAARA